MGGIGRLPCMQGGGGFPCQVAPSAAVEKGKCAEKKKGKKRHDAGGWAYVAARKKMACSRLAGEASA